MKGNRFEYCSLPPVFAPSFTELEFCRKQITPSVLTLPILEKPVLQTDAIPRCYPCKLRNVACDRNKPACLACVAANVRCVFPTFENETFHFYAREDPEPLFVNSDLAHFNENILSDSHHFPGNQFSAHNARKMIRNLDTTLPGNDIPERLLLDLMREQHDQDRKRFIFDPFIGNRMTGFMQTYHNILDSKHATYEELIFTPTGPNLNDLTLFRIQREEFLYLENNFLKDLQIPIFSCDMEGEIMQLDSFSFPNNPNLKLMGARNLNMLRLYSLKLPEIGDEKIRQLSDSYDLAELEIIRFKNTRLFHFAFNPVLEYETGMVTENGSLYLWRPNEELECIKKGTEPIHWATFEFASFHARAFYYAEQNSLMLLDARASVPSAKSLPFEHNPKAKEKLYAVKAHPNHAYQVMLSTTSHFQLFDQRYFKTPLLKIHHHLSSPIRHLQFFMPTPTRDQTFIFGQDFVEGDVKMFCWNNPETGDEPLTQSSIYDLDYSKVQNKASKLFHFVARKKTFQTMTKHRRKVALEKLEIIKKELAENKKKMVENYEQERRRNNNNANRKNFEIDSEKDDSESENLRAKQRELQRQKQEIEDENEREERERENERENENEQENENENDDDEEGVAREPVKWLTQPMFLSNYLSNAPKPMEGVNQPSFLCDTTNTYKRNTETDILMRNISKSRITGILLLNLSVKYTEVASGTAWLVVCNQFGDVFQQHILNGNDKRSGVQPLYKDKKIIWQNFYQECNERIMKHEELNMNASEYGKKNMSSVLLAIESNKRKKEREGKEMKKQPEQTNTQQEDKTYDFLMEIEMKQSLREFISSPKTMREIVQWLKTNYSSKITTDFSMSGIRKALDDPSISRFNLSNPQKLFDTYRKSDPRSADSIRIDLSRRQKNPYDWYPDRIAPSSLIDMNKESNKHLLSDSNEVFCSSIVYTPENLFTEKNAISNTIVKPTITTVLTPSQRKRNPQPEQTEGEKRLIELKKDWNSWNGTFKAKVTLEILEKQIGEAEERTKATTTTTKTTSTKKSRKNQKGTTPKKTVEFENDNINDFETESINNNNNNDNDKNETNTYEEQGFIEITSPLASQQRRDFNRRASKVVQNPEMEDSNYDNNLELDDVIFISQRRNENTNRINNNDFHNLNNTNDRNQNFNTNQNNNNNQSNNNNNNRNDDTEIVVTPVARTRKRSENFIDLEANENAQDQSNFESFFQDSSQPLFSESQTTTTTTTNRFSQVFSPPSSQQQQSQSQSQSQSYSQSQQQGSQKKKRKLGF